MKKIDKKKIEEFIRVDHAGERGAVKIYEGQLLALNTFVKNDKLKETIEEMKIHEKEHRDFFEQEIKKRNIAQQNFYLFGICLVLHLDLELQCLEKKAAMLCTASVEEVIDDHYKNQLNKLGDDEKSLKKSISKFRDDENDHKNIAYDKGATKQGLYSILDIIIKTSSKAAIKVSEKI